MPDLPEVEVVVSSIEAGENGAGVAIVRFTNPFAESDFYIRVPVKNLNSPELLKQIGSSVRTFADAFAMAGSQPLRFSK